MRIFFSVGEPSGDLHGGNLIRELKRLNPRVECIGYGGPKMADAGCNLHEDLTRWAIMGFAQVFRNLRTFWRLMQRADDILRTERPDAVVLIDYPGFNLRLAQRAKKYDIPVFYYGAPQMWAWGAWRVPRLKRRVDHLLCKLPFEAIWYQQRGCNAHYVGHPYFDQLQQQILDIKFIHKYQRSSIPVVLVLPGSRTQEVKSNIPWFLKAAKKIHRAVGNVRFAVAAFNDKHAQIVFDEIANQNVCLPIDVLSGRTQELMELCRCCLACSGSVSLELLYRAKPTVIHYRTHSLMYNLVGRFLMKVKYITLVNLLASDNPYGKPREYRPHLPGAEQVVFPEYATYKDRSTEMAKHIVDWLTDESEYERKQLQLRRVLADFGPINASQRAARYIVQNLQPAALMQGKARAA